MHVSLSNLLSVCDNAFMNGFPLILGARCAYTMPRGGSVHFVLRVSIIDRSTERPDKMR